MQGVSVGAAGCQCHVKAGPLQPIQVGEREVRRGNIGRYQLRVGAGDRVNAQQIGLTSARKAAAVVVGSRQGQGSQDVSVGIAQRGERLPRRRSVVEVVVQARRVALASVGLVNVIGSGSWSGGADIRQGCGGLSVRGQRQARGSRGSRQIHSHVSKPSAK